MNPSTTLIIRHFNQFGHLFNKYRSFWIYQDTFSVPLKFASIAITLIRHYILNEETDPLF